MDEMVTRKIEETKDQKRGEEKKHKTIGEPRIFNIMLISPRHHPSLQPDPREGVLAPVCLVAGC
jgi:hypothetical protein